MAEGASVNKLSLWKFTGNALSPEEIKQFQESPPNVYGYGHLDFLRDVVESIQHDRIPAIDGNEGRKAVQLLHALYKSAETGVKVYLRDAPVSNRLGVH
jgi:predicted dehydrogenase